GFWLSDFEIGHSAIRGRLPSLSPPFPTAGAHNVRGVASRAQAHDPSQGHFRKSSRAPRDQPGTREARTAKGPARTARKFRDNRAWDLDLEARFLVTFFALEKSYPPK